ncbi:uncharacterized protein LACBIDRAFT_322484 [Laccaria bicolor S238N-H82]|uniref:Predicted protein n=1 Tax=Laccaria bicolor (strain S238N-H82 / ATCC MYA-4686) TaxID=486041 RepID=B0CWG4_LACBS|nr:uncharacterized protein LACBIDRAFT_322484 [Laccaria bicolor S238N-H82]EDR13064.1 predicted protein [Laccaria bicolor S238N-H82]|eukprot:XP_001875562.1 predicted protein [Laccaria bicolor S238N-H82]
MCRAWVVAGVMPVVVRTEEWGGGAYVPLAHDVATSWALSLVLGPSFRAGGVVVVSVGVVRHDDMACPQLSLTHTICIACLLYSPLDWDWTLKSGWQSSGSPVDWTGLDWTGHSASQSGLVRGPLESTGVHWSPYGLCGGGIGIIDDIEGSILKVFIVPH